MKQLHLPFANDLTDDCFVELPENSEALNFLQNFYLKNKNIADFKLLTFSNIIIKGDEFCGKNNLLKFFANQNNLAILTHQQIQNLDFLAKLTPKSFFIVQDIDLLEDEILLRLINFAYEKELFLIFSLQNIAKFKLKDLFSRLKNIPTKDISNLSEQSVKYLLSSQLAKKQIVLSSKKLDFLTKNSPRSYNQAQKIIIKVEKFYQDFAKEPKIKDLQKIVNSD